MHLAEQRLKEYVDFKVKFPRLNGNDKKKLLDKIQEVLGYEQFKDLKVMDLNFDHCVDGSPTLDEFSIASGVSLK